MPRYAVPIFVGAFLLFQVQPIIARCILPWFGGSPSVWTTCMLFFQLLLLAGYAYSHLLIDRAVPRRQATLHSALVGVSLAVLVTLAIRWGSPILPSPGWKPSSSSQPALRIIGLLAVTVGLPYLVLATTSPLLQAWFSRRLPGLSPYRLYTISNAGSVLALLSYPFLVEPTLTLRTQAWVWGAGYALFAAGAILCAADARRNHAGDGDTVEPAASSASPGARSAPTAVDPAFPSPLPASPAPAPPAPDSRAPDSYAPVPRAPSLRTTPPPAAGRSVKVLWVLLPALACALFLAVTNQMCQEVAVIPFLWILPLTIYLFSFIICFYSEHGYRRLFYLLALIVVVAAALAIIPRSNILSTRLQIVIHAVALFVCCMVCHGELAATKPEPRRLTAFYLATAVGGALGGVFVGLLAPLLFRRYWELQLGLILCWAIGLGALWVHRRRWPRWLPQIAMVASAVAAVLLVRSLPSDARLGAHDVAVLRNFYGVLQISEQHGNVAEYHRRVMVHGRTIHGIQYVSEAKRLLPTSYYGAESGVGVAMRLAERQATARPGSSHLRVGITGLGVGTIAAYGRPGDTYRFYEINPDVVRVARDPTLFTYLSDAGSNVEIILGDARVSLEREMREGPQQFDIMILDAFSGDAVPAHLLTREAFLIYLRHLRDPGGLLAIHVTNRVLDLKPVIWGLAESLGLTAVFVHTPGDKTTTFEAEWMLLSRDPAFVRQPEIASSGTTLHEPLSAGVWTDDYHPLLPIMK